MENDYQTPMKSHEGAGDGASTIAHGLTDKNGMTESKLQHEHGQEQQNERNEQEKRLDQIEKQIHEIGEQLRTLHLEISGSTDLYSEDLLNKERYRSELKKRIIDLDYEHKQLISKRIQEERKHKEEKAQQFKKQMEEREEQRRQELEEREQRRRREIQERQERIRQDREERQERIRQEREERERRRKEELDRYEQEYRERLRNLSGSRKEEEQKRQDQSGEQTQEQGQQQQQGEQSKAQGQASSQNAEDELARSRRRLRIAEIEAELAVSRLERSRISSLTTELEALRLSYLDPYYVYRPFALPSYYYPYSAYPVYARWWYY